MGKKELITFLEKIGISYFVASSVVCIQRAFVKDFIIACKLNKVMIVDMEGFYLRGKDFVAKLEWVWSPPDEVQSQPGYEKLSYELYEQFIEEHIEEKDNVFICFACFDEREYKKFVIRRNKYLRNRKIG
jgi:hypothetical protein